MVMKMKKKLAVVFVCILTFCMMAGCGGKTENSSDAKEETGTQETDMQKPDIQESNTQETDTQEPDTKETEDAAEPQERLEKSEEDILEETIGQYMDQMTVEEKVAQLFIILPEALIKEADPVTSAGEATKQAIEQTPVGGFIYLDNNLNSREQVKTMLENVQAYSMERIDLPMFLCVDEEGGAVARIGKSGKFDVPQIENMSVIGARGNTDEAYETGKTIGAYLNDLGFNVDFAPVADVLTNQDNQVVKERAFGSDPELVSSMALAVAQGLKEQNICAVYKHFPGHGGTAADTHEGYAYVDKSIEELEDQDLVPFREAIRNGAEVIMVGHISLPDVTGNDTPASMSPEIITDLLRTQMQYDGLVVTDALNMGAVTEQYSSSEAAVQTILAGSDLVLMPENFEEAYQGVLDAVENGTISRESLEESLRRILEMKISIIEKRP